MYPNIHCGTIYDSQDMEATQISTDRWMDKEVVIRIYNGILLSHKKEWIWVSSSEVDEPRKPVVKSGVSQTETSIIY